MTNKQPSQRNAETAVLLLLFKQFSAVLVVGHIMLHKCPKRFSVVVVLNMCKLVQNNVINSFGRISHKQAGKANRIFAAAASETCFGTGDFHSARS